MKHFYIFILFFISPISAQAQWHDQIFHFGGGGGQDTFGISAIDFSDTENIVSKKVSEFTAFFYGTNTSMSDSLGNVQFLCTGDKIYNHTFQVMENGSGLVNNSNGYGYIVPQGVLALPMYGSSEQYYLFNMEWDKIPNMYYGARLFENKVDMTYNNGLGKVIEKRHLLIEDTLTFGSLTATKHANGRDWWLLVFKRRAPEYYTLLVSPEGISIQLNQINQEYKLGGQNHFTPDGSKFIMVDHTSYFPPAIVTIFDFDRCTGLLSNQRQHELLDSNMIFTGGATSHDSRFLYAFYDEKTYQYDLKAADIFASEEVVAVWDSTKHFIWPSNMTYGQLAPDGRIYVNSDNGSMSLHTIDFPHRKGLACNFIQNKIQSATLIQYDMPNHPNYRLGPIDGSSCDTLGINNNPLAHYRWDLEDTLRPFALTFTDLSFYEPASWSWDFGDGSTSSVQSPVHDFPGTGVYEVCLEVCNAYSCDTRCKTIYLGLSGAEEVTLQPKETDIFVLFPNPVQDQLFLEKRKATTPTNCRLELFDLSGKNLLSVEFGAKEKIEIDLSSIEQGLYLYRIKSETGVLVQAGKLVRM